MAFGDKAIRRLLGGARARIVAALKFRAHRLAQQPKVAELEFISLTANHAQFSDKLRNLGQISAAAEIQRNAFYVGLRWVRRTNF